jgi:hypothetical protein
MDAKKTFIFENAVLCTIMYTNWDTLRLTRESWRNMEG